MHYPAYRWHKQLLVYVPPFLIIFGSFGNLLSFVILRKRNLRRYSSYFYLCVLSLADILVLYVGLLRLWIGELTGRDLRDQHDWLCKLTSVTGYTISDYSVWLIIAVTAERYLVVCRPLRAHHMCNTSRAWKVFICLLVAMLLVNIHFLWTVQIVYYKHNDEYIPQCAGADGFRFMIDKVWPWVDACIYSLVPFVVILVLNILIVRQIVRARRTRRALQQSTNSYGGRSRTCSFDNNKLTVMLLAISFSFLITTLPNNVSLIASIFWSTSGADLTTVTRYKLVRTITELLMYVNHSMNFYLYCATGQKFREQLALLFCKRPLYTPPAIIGLSHNHSQNTNDNNRRKICEGEVWIILKGRNYCQTKVEV